MDTPQPELTIAAAVILDRGAILVARRPAGAHLEGLWEFPGGKVRPGESPEAAVRREVREEVGLELDTIDLLHREPFAYPDRTVDIFFYLAKPVSRERGSSADRGLEGQELAWKAVSELRELRTPPANHAVIQLLLEQFS